MPIIYTSIQYVSGLYWKMYYLTESRTSEDPKVKVACTVVFSACGRKLRFINKYNSKKKKCSNNKSKHFSV